MRELRAVLKDKRHRMRLKSFTASFSIAGVAYTALSFIGGNLGLSLSRHAPAWFGKDLDKRERWTYLAIAGAVGIVCYFVRSWYFQRIFDFFGVSTDRALLFVLPTLHLESQSVYKERPNGHEVCRKRHRQSTASIYAHHNFDLVFNILRSETELRYLDLSFEMDEKIMPTVDSETADVYVDGKTVICLGSSAINNLCAHLLQQHPYSDQSFFYTFVEDIRADRKPESEEARYILRRNGDVPDHPLLPLELEDDDRTDYAVFLRHTQECTTYFACAGLGRTGTESTVQFLFQDWTKIAKQTGGRDFYFLTKIEKKSKHREPIIEAVKRVGSEETLYDIHYPPEGF